MGRKRVITEAMTDEEKLELCIKEAKDLTKHGFEPGITEEDSTIQDVLFKVLTEWDLATEGSITVPKTTVRQAERFLARWKDHDKETGSMYDRFVL